MSSYRTQIGAAGAYYGLSDTATTWPAKMGGANGPNAFIAGIVGQFLSGASQSTLKPRAVAAYSNRSSSTTFQSRLTNSGRQIPARFGPVHASFPALSPSKPY
jgi:hypothetical protein